MRGATTQVWLRPFMVSGPNRAIPELCRAGAPEAIPNTFRLYPAAVAFSAKSPTGSKTFSAENAAITSPGNERARRSEVTVSWNLRVR